jgi:hypothetical protein
VRALRFDRFGVPGVLRLAELPDPVASAGEAVIRVQAASVNPSDVKNVGGAMEGTVPPQVRGRDLPKRPMLSVTSRTESGVGAAARENTARHPRRTRLP